MTVDADGVTSCVMSTGGEFEEKGLADGVTSFMGDTEVNKYVDY